MKSKTGFLLAGIAIGAFAFNLDAIYPDRVEAQSTTPILAEKGILESDAAIAASAAQAIAPLPQNRYGQLSFADVVERVSPAVVSVLVEREVEAPQRPRVPPGFERFFGFPGIPDGGPDNDDPFEEDGVRRAAAQGSGFFIDGAGHIVTNHHVVSDGTDIKVALADGKELDAELIGSDPLTDLAVLKVKPPKGQRYVTFAEDVNLRVGDWVVAVGNPFGLGGTVTSGIVSAIGGRNREQQYLDLIQIDAAINRGNSGGPAFDLSGTVVGVNVAIYSPNGGNVGIGFAIPAATAKATVAQLIDNGEVTRGYLGINLAPVSEDIAAALDLEDTDGVLVDNVNDGTPADKAGVRNGDVITKIDNRLVRGPNDLSRRIANYPPGRKIKVEVVRDGRTQTLNVTLGERPSEVELAQSEPVFEDESSTLEELGVRVSSLTDSLRSRYRIEEEVRGVVATAVKPGSPAERAGLQPGVVILEFDRKPVTSPGDLENKIKNARESKKDAAFIRFQSGSVKRYSALRLQDD